MAAKPPPRVVNVAGGSQVKAAAVMTRGAPAPLGTGSCRCEEEADRAGPDDKREMRVLQSPLEAGVDVDTVGGHGGSPTRDYRGGSDCA
jgi:hypothetical protein